SSTPEISSSGSNTVTASASGGNQSVTLSGSPSGVSIFTFDSKRIIVVDKKTAGGFWLPRIKDTNDIFDHYDLSPNSTHALIHGPYLIRSASVNGTTLALAGDLNGTTTLQIFAPTTFSGVTWN
ncbi:hypothetical protein MPER_14108, partial [Moniliophthora perniciosa FA553]